MVQRVDDYPIKSGIITMSAVASLVDGVPSTVTAWVVSMEELLPTAADFIQNNNLLPEITSRAGLNEETVYSAINQVSYSVVNDHHTYVLSLVVSSS